MKEFIFPDDKYKMNWVEGKTEWGTVKAPDSIDVTRHTEKTNDGLVERYVFTNVSNKDVFTKLRDISIYVPFNDDYTDSETCVKKRCHTHIWCGDEITYVMALRMGSEAPHLGLVLTEGTMGGYSVERDTSRLSNDRGDFIFHPSPVSLVSGESFTVEWRLFRHDGKADFYNKLRMLCPKYIHVSAEEYVVFKGEEIRINIEPVFDFEKEDIVITRDGQTVEFGLNDGVISITETPENTGEYSYSITVKGVKTHCNIFVHLPLEELAYKRCRFIAEKQQYHNPNSKLDGAFLIYDNEEKHVYYNPNNDYNGARERVGMGILLARYLQNHDDEVIKKSLDKYVRYVKREIFDSESGMVYNDYNHNNDWFRLYNFPWMSVFFLELFDLYGEKEYLINAYKIMKSFYDNGGAHFYAIEIPIVRITAVLEKEGMTDLRDTLMDGFREHCDFILEQGVNYPPHEVNYEQSIVAPAANILLQMYMVTKEEKYLDGAKIQLNVLELFNGLQPDYHMYEVAIRHWDGYWFGKRKLYGDTYPHYWSALTANAYKDYGQITKNPQYAEKAETAYRAVLSLILLDGTASCAYVYPMSVNGTEAHCYDVYANDQDWALYFMLRHRENYTLL